MEQTADEILRSVKDLVNAWCDRRCLSALKFILQGYPLASPLTDGWADLLKALEDVQAFAGDEIIASERQITGELIRAVHRIVYRT